MQPLRGELGYERRGGQGDASEHTPRKGFDEPEAKRRAGRDSHRCDYRARADEPLLTAFAGRPGMG